MAEYAHTHKWEASGPRRWTCSCGGIGYGENPPREAPRVDFEAVTFARGYRAGLEAAAKLCDQIAEIYTMFHREEKEATEDCAKAIRALATDGGKG